MARLIATCRFLLVVPVVGCLILTAGTVILGMGRIYDALTKFTVYGGFTKEAAKKASLAVIEIIDLFLVATVAYIAAVGLYKLFISKVEIQLPMRLKIGSLKDLEDKIIGVIVAALAVAFLGQAAGSDEPTELLNYGGGIALVIVALGFFVRGDGKKPAPEKPSAPGE